MSGAFRIEDEKREPAIDVVAGLRSAQATGRSMTSLVTEIVRLLRGPGRLTPREYFAYGLYDDRFTWEEKRRFLGKRAQDRIFARCTDERWWLTAHDKLLFASLMRGAGLPVPKTVAVYHRVRRDDGARPLGDGDALGAFLREADAYPLFAKPVDGMHGVGSASLGRYAREDDVIVAASGDRCPVDTFVGDVERFAERGYLFQERLRPHPDVARVCGDRVATVRIVIAMAGGDPEVLRCLWKIPGGGNVSDNFWRPGNLLAAVDRPTGRVSRAVRGRGADMETVDEHPDTGEPLVGFTLPGWNEILEIARHGARVLAGLSLQAWDVAITDRGPVLVEANIGGDVDLPQLADDEGLLDERFESVLRDLGYEP